jgi:signal transduction histidine kinase
MKNVHSIRYLLSHGHYKLSIKGSSDGSTWSENYMLPIIIYPAWWQTRWFRWLAGLSILGLFGSGAWYYSRIRTSKLKELLELEQEMQKERERISRDLHDNIGAYSTALIANADSLEQVIHDKEGREKIQYLKENARNILSMIRETIWLLNSNNLTISGFTEGFINYCTNILRNYEGIEIEFNEDIIENKTLSPAVAINLLRIMQEIIQNTVKHAKASKITCYIKSEDQLSITITDNGTGFNTSLKSYGNGLKNINLRAHDINFMVTLKSEHGKGTHTTLTGKI